jgi:hypothetical protein
MSVNIDPFVRRMIVCDDIVRSSRNQGQLDAIGLVNYVRPETPGRYPVRLRQLAVLVELTGGRGTGEGQIVVVAADTDEPVFASPVHTWSYPADPLRVLPVVFRIRECSFPRSGVYWVQFWHRGRKFTEYAIRVE